MNLKAVAGAIKSPKTPQRLKDGLIKKYGKQLGISKGLSTHHIDKHMLKDVFPMEMPLKSKRAKKKYSILKEDVCKTCKKPQLRCSCGDDEARKNPSSRWHKEQESFIRKKTIMSDYQEDKQTHTAGVHV